MLQRDRELDGNPSHGIAFIMLFSIAEVKNKCNDIITFILTSFSENRAVQR